MAGLYVPLNVYYFEDEKIIDAGPMAELLYVRGLAFAKRVGSDGRISANQLRTIGARLPRAGRLVDRLVDVELWEANGSAWIAPGYLSWNPPSAEVHKTKSAAGSLGNHRRWHLPPTGTPKTDCTHCQAEGLLR